MRLFVGLAIIFMLCSAPPARSQEQPVSADPPQATADMAREAVIAAIAQHRAGSDDRVHAAPNIPAGVAENAREACRIAADEELLGVADSSGGQNGRSGLCFLRDRIISKRAASRDEIHYEQLRGVPPRNGTFVVHYGDFELYSNLVGGDRVAAIIADILENRPATAPDMTPGRAPERSQSLSIAWDAGEGVRYLFLEGCLPAVAQNRPLREVVDRRPVPLSRVRTLDASPFSNDPPGTPAYAVISGASVVMTGTAERCRIGTSNQDAAEIRASLLDILDVQQTGWTPVSDLPAPPSADIAHDARCRPIEGGVMLVSIVTAAGRSTSLQVVVSRNNLASCSP